MKKSPKTKELKSNTQVECYTKSSIQETGYYSWKDIPVSEAYLDTLARELIEWIQTNDRPVKIRDFFRMKHIFDRRVFEWRNKYPRFREVYEEALLAIGDRRETKAFYGEGNANLQMRTAHQYDPEWHEVNRYHSDMKKDEEGSKKQDITVIYSPVPEHDLIKKSTS